MKTLAVVILDKFADWEPALLTAGLQSIIGGYTVRWASVDRKVKTSMGGLRVEPDMTISEIPSTADTVIVIGAEGSWRTLPAEDSQQLASILGDFKDAGKPVGGICDGAYSWLLLACSMDAGTPPMALRTSRICLPTRTRIST